MQILYVYYYVSADEFILHAAKVKCTKPVGGRISTQESGEALKFANHENIFSQISILITTTVLLTSPKYFFFKFLKKNKKLAIM